jgi:hypothetical protein
MINPVCRRSGLGRAVRNAPRRRGIARRVMKEWNDQMMVCPSGPAKRAITIAQACCSLPVLLAASLWSGSIFAASPAEDGFRRLSGVEIRKAFIGKTFTDETHFSNLYRANGIIEGVSMGVKASSTWRIVKDELCITNRFGEHCYGVWKKGSEVRLVYKSSEVTIDGSVK